MVASGAGLQTHIWNNNLKSVLLLAVYPFILMVLVWLCAYVVAYASGGYHMEGLETPSGYIWVNTGNPEYVASHVVAQYWPLILTVVALWFVVAWFFQSSMIRALSHARPVSRTEEPELYNLLENLCIAQGMPTPRLEIVETHARNAFASGIDRNSYCVTVTRGLMKSLTREELEGVMAHELTHIINRDVRLMMVAVIFTGMIGFAAQMVWSQLRYGYVFSGQRRGRGNGILVLLAIGAVLWIGYMATVLTRLALSRRREYMADAGAVRMTRNPEAMMGALMRIAGKAALPGAPDDLNMMCTENARPFMGLFATHPPIEARIKALAAVTGAQPPVLSIPPADEATRFEKSAERRNPWLMQNRRR